MPRHARNIVDERIYHVCNRGVERAPVFDHDDDMVYAELLLASLRRDFPVKIYAYCLMPNHWHMLVAQTEPHALSRFVGAFTRTQAETLRECRGTLGRGYVYQGRFESFPVRAPELLRVTKYVERNALTGGLVAAAERWRFGSLYHRLLRSELAAQVLEPMPLPSDWVRVVNQQLDDGEWREFKKSMRSGLRLGEKRPGRGGAKKDEAPRRQPLASPKK
jgi:putative transposase